MISQCSAFSYISAYVMIRINLLYNVLHHIQHINKMFFATSSILSNVLSGIFSFISSSNLLFSHLLFGCDHASLNFGKIFTIISLFISNPSWNFKIFLPKYQSPVCLSQTNEAKSYCFFVCLTIFTELHTNQSTSPPRQ